MRRTSLTRASAMRPSTTRKPIWVRRVRTSTGSGLRRTASISRNSTWPPSRTGTGTRFRTARFTEKKATNVRNRSIPSRTTWPEIWPTRMGPPMSRGESWPSTNPLRKPSTRLTRAIVSSYPVTTARPSDSRTWMVGGSGPAPMARPQGPVLQVQVEGLGASGDREVEVRPAAHDPLDEVVPGAHRIAVEPHDAVAVAQRGEAFRPRRQDRRGDRVDLRGRELRRADRGRDAGVDREREHEVHRHARQHHDEARGDRLTLDHPRGIDRRGRGAALERARRTFLLERRELDVASEGEQ